MDESTRKSQELVEEQAHLQLILEAERLIAEQFHSLHIVNAEMWADLESTVSKYAAKVSENIIRLVEQQQLNQ